MLADCMAGMRTISCAAPLRSTLGFFSLGFGPVCVLEAATVKSDRLQVRLAEHVVVAEQSIDLRVAWSFLQEKIKKLGYEV